jgi:hypothetical protein
LFAFLPSFSLFAFDFTYVCIGNVLGALNLSISPSFAFAFVFAFVCIGAMLDTFCSGQFSGLSLLCLNSHLYVLVKCWTFDPVNFPVEEMRVFTDELHANDQYFVTIVDPGIKEEVGLVVT